jgi:hypothetical protein
MLFRNPNSRCLSRRALGTAAAAATAAVTAIAPAGAPADTIFRAFSPSSPWNAPAAPDSIAPSNPFAGQFTSYSSELSISGTPDNPEYASPIFFASPGDPSTSKVDLTTDWSPTHDVKWDGRAIPVPNGVHPAPGSDGHLTIVSADRSKAWDFWRCTKVSGSGITTAVIVQWNLNGPGYSSHRSENSARGSGTPLISTTLRADEALSGITHALGITVPSVSSDYVYPVATHSDGNDGSGAIKYGMRFVLRPDYPIRGSIGARNVLQALKTYGAYVIDQGASFELDADSTHADLWAQTGLKESTLDVRARDMRPAQAGTGSVPPPSANRRKARRRAVVLRVNTHKVWAGGQLRLRGKVRRPAAGLRVRLEVRVGHRWHRLRRKPVEADGTFQTWPHLGRSAHASRYGGRLHLKRVHLRPGARRLKLRAVVPHVGRSNVIRVRIRH